MDSWATYFERPTTPAEVYIYDHLMRQARTVSPTVVVEQFRQLFVEGHCASHPRVVKALEWIVNAQFAHSEFKFILNRSYYIVINAWCETGRNRIFIPDLVDVMQSLPAPLSCGSGGSGHGITNRALRTLVRGFVASEQYQALRRLAWTIRSDSPQTAIADPNQPSLSSLSLETIIHRYPYVYEYNLLTQDSTLEQRRTIQAMRQQAQSQYDRNLSRYIAYRQSQPYRNVRPLPATNPTLLSDKQLNCAIAQYSGKIDGRNTQRDLANRFLTYSRWTRSYGELKGDLYTYLTTTMEPWFAGPRFSQKLSDRLQATLSQYDDHPPTSALFQETCKSLLNFLVVESSKHPDHRNFIDLIGNLGSILTVTVLLKIVLLCEQSKPWLERRFAILFNHYGDRPQSDVKWLVESMETLNVAMSTNFSTICTAKL